MTESRKTRWNGWGFTDVDYPLNRATRRFLRQELGKAHPFPEATLDQVLDGVPNSRLPSHPLISKDREVRVRHASGQSVRDWIAMKSGEFLAFPDGVAFPETSEQVHELLEWAKSHRIIVIPYGGGTSVVGGVTVYSQKSPVLTISLAKMNQLIQCDKMSRLARFGAGVTGLDLEAQLRPLGFRLGHYPQSFELSTLGGWIATRSKGQQSLKYGGIEELFAGGRIETFQGKMEIPAFPSSAAGPDLRHFVLGSEGRVGIITEAVERVHPIPVTEEINGCFFPSWNTGLEAVRALVQSGIPLSMLRLSNAKETEAQLTMAGHPWMIGLMNFGLKLRGISKGKCFLLVRGGKEALKLIKKQKGVVVGKSLGEKWKKSRFLVPYLRENLWREGYVVDTLETACTWPKVNEMVAAIETALEAALEEKVFAFTHLSHPYSEGSSVYATYLFRQGHTSTETLARWKRLKTAASEAIVALGGTISHQHGIGVDHRPYLAKEKGEIGVAALKAVCTYFDPDHLLNPQKLVDES